jgi:hypothetical protein
MADVTLHIGGEAEGAAEAARKAADAVKDLGAAAGSAGAPVTGVGTAAQQAGQGMELTGGQARRLAQTLMQLGVVPRELSGSLSYLIATGFNPAFAGFAAGIFVVQGLISVFNNLAEATEKQKQKMQELADTTLKAMEALESVQRIKGPLTQEKARALREEQLSFQIAGLTPEAAIKVQEVLEKKGGKLTPEERVDVAYGLTGRQPGDPTDDSRMVRRLINDGDLRKTRAAQGQAAVNETDSMRRRAVEATARMKAERQLSPKDALIRAYSQDYSVSTEEAERDFRVATDTRGAFEDYWREIDVNVRSTRFSKVASEHGIGGLVQPRRRLGEGTSPNPQYLTINNKYIGTQFSIHPGQDAADHGAPAQVRGASE